MKNNSDLAWEQFIKTGRVETYLRYRGIKERMDKGIPSGLQSVKQPSYQDPSSDRNPSVQG